MGIGIWEILVIFLIILLVFGAKRLPEVARSMGKAVSEFKKAQNELLNETETANTTATKTGEEAPKSEQGTSTDKTDLF